MAIPSIPGLNVEKIGRNRYAVSADNGNTGAVVINKSQLKTLADVYGVREEKNSKGKKIAAGIAAGLLTVGAVAAAIVYRKNIGKFFNGLKETKFGKAFDGVMAKAAAGVESAKETVAKGAKKVKEKGGKWYERAADFAKKVWTTVKDFFKKGWEVVSDTFKGLFKKTDSARPRDAKGRFTSVNK